jgi:hypothetical protein
VAGVILEKWVNTQYEILRYLEDSSQKLEIRQPAVFTISVVRDNFIVTFGGDCAFSAKPIGLATQS